jgi:FkbM family methyltransferase
VIFQSFIRSVFASRRRIADPVPPEPNAFSSAPGTAETRVTGSADAKDWRTRPRYDVSRVAVFKQLNDPNRPLRFAELDLDGCIVRYCVTSPSSEWRVQTLFTKEPGTIDWIHSFNRGQTLVDVGANVGMYSIYAGVVAGAHVFAFEPESQNYAELCRSIFFNEAARKNIVAWCAAVSDEPVEISRLLVRDLHTGYSFHDFGEPSRDYSAAERFAQGSVAFSLDHLVASGAVPEPDHVKIDVDGHEDKVVRGMRGLLERRIMRTVLIEADPSLAGTRGITQRMLADGWIVNPDQVRFSRDGLRPAEPVMAEVAAGTFTGNIIFGRGPEDVAFATTALGRYSASELERMALPA